MAKKALIAAMTLALGSMYFNPSRAELFAQTKPAAAPQQGQVQQPASTERQVTPQEAFTLLSKAAGEGQPQAMNSLGTLYEQGLGVARNYSRALEWYQKAANAGLPVGFHQVGLAYEQGKGVPANRDEAIKNFQKAAQMKLEESGYRLAALALAGTGQSDDAKAVEYLAAMGRTPAEAMELAGTYYENGTGVAVNYSKAFQWYKKAAEAGLPGAHYRLGVCYELGLGVSADPKAAVAAFQKASDLKLPDASYKLASIYLEGVLATADNKKAIEYMTKATDSGHHLAANQLGVIYLDGLLGQAKDPEKALTMFKKSSSLGNPEAMKNVAVIYRNGIGRKADPAEALKWYLIAKKSGYEAEGFSGIIDELSKSLKAADVKKAEEAADKWIAESASKEPAAKK